MNTIIFFVCTIRGIIKAIRRMIHMSSNYESEGLTELTNIGPELCKQLQEIGIHTREALKETGSRDAWLAIQKTDPSACYNRLCALEGAIQGIKKIYLSNSDIQKLKQFYQENKKRWSK